MLQARTLPPVVRGRWYPMTWEEFLIWAPNEGQAEWVDGEGIAYVSNSALHMRKLGFFAELLRVYVRIFDLGEVFFDQFLMRLPTRPSGRMPDIFVIGRDDAPRVHYQWFDGPALFVAEFVSDDSVERDLVDKRAEYERAGVPEYLAVEARLGRDGLTYLRRDAEGHYQTVTPDEHGRYHSEVLPGFWFDPSWFTEDPLPNPLVVLRRISPEAWRRLVEEVEAEP
jgi:Uma2 family endonuclease